MHYFLSIFCREILKVQLIDLPTNSDMSELFCDTCIKLKKGNVAAVSYCTNDSCKKRYCTEHKKVTMLPQTTELFYL